MKHMKNLMIAGYLYLSLAACGSSNSNSDNTTAAPGQGNGTNPIITPATTKTTIGTVDSVSSSAFTVQGQSFNFSSSTVSYAKQNLAPSVLTSGSRSSGDKRQFRPTQGRTQSGIWQVLSVQFRAIRCKSMAKACN